MKRMTLILGAIMVFCLSLQAQIHLFLSEQDIAIEDAISTAWVFPVAGDTEGALNDLKSFCKERSDLKMKKGGENMLIAEKASLTAVATKRGDLIGFAYTAEQKECMAIVFQLGYDISLNSSDWEQEMENLRHYTKSFMSYHYEAVYSQQIKELEKELKDTEKEKSKDENDIDRLNDRVASLGKKIAKETETEKINALEEQIRTLDADVRVLMEALPPLEAKIVQLNERLEKQKTESHSYQTAIGAF